MSHWAMPSTVKLLPRSLPPRQEMRSAPEPPVPTSSRSRLTRGSMRMMSRTSRLKLGAVSRTSAPKAVPGPTVRSWTLARVAVTTMVSDAAASAASRAKVRVVEPCSEVFTSSTVWPWRPGAVAVIDVGAADGEAARREDAVATGRQGSAGAVAGVGDDDGRVGDRSAVRRGDLALDAGGDLLRISGDRQGNRHGKRGGHA